MVYSLLTLIFFQDFLKLMVIREVSHQGNTRTYRNTFEEQAHHSPKEVECWAVAGTTVTTYLHWSAQH